MVVAVRLLQADDDLVKLLSLLRQRQLRPQKIDQFTGDTNFSCLKSNIYNIHDFKDNPLILDNDYAFTLL